MSNRLFGTDGVRGRAGQYPLDEETIARLGAALVKALPFGGTTHRLLVGRDTRESGPWIEQALAHGARAAGARVTSAGVVPTPMVAYLTKSMDFDAGVVISASHNPFEDNGIKVFSGDGEKFDEHLEDHIEAVIADASWQVGTETGPPVEVRDFTAMYIAHARTALPDLTALRRSRLVIDCANGATSTVAPRLFRELGFDVTPFFCEPDGRNINLGCGSTHPDRLRAAVVDGGHRLGIAFDGDGDRCLLVDHTGRLVDGDAIMLMCAKHLKRHGELKGDTVVATVMSNIGLEIALREAGIELLRTQVGDKYVMEQLIERGLSLGGEQSGHVIFSDFLFTGDGLVTALSVLRVMAESGRELADLADELVTYPQVLVNVRVKERRPLHEVPAIADVMAEVERRLAGDGRLLVRYSGTEPLLRIMLEGRDQGEIQQWAEDIVSVVRRELA
ncbi:MAG: phosphoglucosamine mutase [Acidobacteria bacterium]|nr:phosphoglucosamine mutase [Acidobacteriota bacterium]